MKNRSLFELSGTSTVLLLVSILAVAVLAFIPSYFTVLSATSLSMHIHAFLMYIWLGGLVSMAILIRSGQRSWHRRIGYASPLVVVAMLYSGFIVTLESLDVGLSELTPEVLRFKRLPVLTLIAFSILYLLGLAFRKHPQAHFRFMISTAILLIGPALRRILLLIPLTKPAYINLSFLLLGALTLALIALDIRKGYVRSPYFVTLALLALVLIGFRYWRAIFAY